MPKLKWNGRRSAKKLMTGISQNAFHHSLKPRCSNKTKATNRQKPKKRK